MALVGRIARTHGLRGEVVVDPETDFPEARFQRGRVVYVQRAGRVEALTIASARLHQGRPIVGFEELPSIADAEALGRVELRVPDEMLEALPSGTFYRHDLVGCRVVTPDGAAVGEVIDVEGRLAGSRLVIERGGEMILVPLATDICVRIDPQARTIVIDPPEGLLDLNRRRKMAEP